MEAVKKTNIETYISCNEAFLSDVTVGHNVDLIYAGLWIRGFGPDSDPTFQRVLNPDPDLTFKFTIRFWIQPSIPMI
jgi:hypothetical protein